MFANHMPDGINLQGPEGNLYIFCQKKRKSSIDMLTQKRGRWLGELHFAVSGSPSLSNSLPFSLYSFQTYKAPSFIFPECPWKWICCTDLTPPHAPVSGHAAPLRGPCFPSHWEIKGGVLLEAISAFRENWGS